MRKRGRERGRGRGEERGEGEERKKVINNIYVNIAEKPCHKNILCESNEKNSLSKVVVNNMVKILFNETLNKLSNELDEAVVGKLYNLCIIVCIG